jgi:hypothetical protein
LRPLTRARLLQRLAPTRPDGRRDPELRGTTLPLRSIARRVLELTAEERELAPEIETITRTLAPQMLEEPGALRTAVAGESAFRDVGGVQLLPHHRFHGVAPKRDD